MVQSQHELHQGETISRGFVKFILLPIVEDLENKTNVKEINEYYRKIAKLGLNGITNNGRKNCIECKDIDDNNSISCKNCLKIVHNTCLSKIIDEDDITRTLAEKDNFNCPACLINPALKKQNQNNIHELDLSSMMIKVKSLSALG